MFPAFKDILATGAYFAMDQSSKTIEFTYKQEIFYLVFFKLFFVIGPETLLKFQRGIVKRTHNFTYHASLSVAPFMYHNDETLAYIKTRTLNHLK